MERNPDPSAALDAVSASRRSLAEQLYTPWWYHPALGTLVGLLQLQIGGALGTTGLYLTALPALGIVALALVYRRLSGIDLSGANAPDGGTRGRITTVLLMGGLLVCLALSFLGGRLGWAWVPWALAGLVLVAVVVVGRAYDEMLRADLRTPAP